MVTYTYDNLNRLLNLVNKINSGADISSFTYTYDKVGNRLSMTTAEGTHNYTYDSIYRLTNADHPAQTDETYTYDKVGNRLTSAQDNDWTYDANNRLSSYNGISYTYDNNGNMISKDDNGSVTSYTYDYENRLVSINYELSTMNYSYDLFGKRLSKTVDGVTTYYLYDNEDIIAEYDSLGSLIASYIHGQGIDEPISMTRAGNTYYYTFDGLGSVVELTDTAGNVVETYSYDSFGGFLRAPPTIDNPYTYTGREYDPETQLYYYRNRYYDPAIGRFISVDLILQLSHTRSWATPYLLHQPQELHFYVYVTNNPINYTDPFGLKIDWGCYWSCVGLFITFGLPRLCSWCVKLGPAAPKACLACVAAVSASAAIICRFACDKPEEPPPPCK
jgi:RHS repeat-associated protein